MQCAQTQASDDRDHESAMKKREDGKLLRILRQNRQGDNNDDKKGNKKLKMTRKKTINTMTRKITRKTTRKMTRMKR